MLNRARRDVSLSVLFVLSLASACATTKQPEPTHAVEAFGWSLDLAEREELPDAVRKLLTDKMQRHGERMMVLFAGVLVLDYRLLEQFALGIAEEPSIGRPAEGERGTLSAMLPPKFFEYEEALGGSANALARAAQRRDGAALVEAFGMTTEVCVGCHITYLHDDLNELEPEQVPALPPRIGSK